MKSAPIRPLGEKVLLKRVEAEEMTSGGIVLPDAAKEKPKRGKILGVGDGKLLDTGKRQPLQVRVGNEVLFTSYAGTEVKVDGDEMIIMDESDILAIPHIELSSRFTSREKTHGGVVHSSCHREVP